MNSGPGRGNPLVYPVSVTIGALAICVAWAPFADLDQIAALATVALGIIGYTTYRLSMALGKVSNGLTGAARTIVIKRVRQEHRLLSRTWLEISGTGRPRWLPVYFDPALLTMTAADGEMTARAARAGGLRLYPSGRIRDTEPAGRLIDNPSRPDPDAPAQATRSTRPSRRLLLDAQSAVAAPFIALLWIYIANDGFPAFLAATCVAAATTIWLSAIRGSDPS
ncbi:hypothetical protein [Nocardia australiensis]|uniref:hypothetical protein n=1 Tax=Nocardia australiensis TaxID=2887191 RepID=UPI001D152FA3|nr:hypothetical protein [Nocardia australiensis]